MNGELYPKTITDIVDTPTMRMPRRPNRLEDAEMVTPTVTLHEELRGVSLSDFTQHFEEDFLQRHVRPQGMVGMTLWGDEPLKSGIHDAMADALGLTPEEAGVFHVRIVPKAQGRLQRSYIVYHERGESHTHLFTLSVTSRQLRDGLLDLTMVEDNGERYVPTLLAWLEERSGTVGSVNDHKQEEAEAKCKGVPKRTPELAKWRAIWNMIRREVTTNGTDDLEFLTGLVKKNFDSQPDYNPKKNPVPSPDTLRKIRQAGINGCLDT